MANFRTQLRMIMAQALANFNSLPAFAFSYFVSPPFPHFAFKLFVTHTSSPVHTSPAHSLPPPFPHSVCLFTSHPFTLLSFLLIHKDTSHPATQWPPTNSVSLITLPGTSLSHLPILFFVRRSVTHNTTYDYTSTEKPCQETSILWTTTRPRPSGRF